ncbi:multidrug ABC transporter permease [Prauserella marina]|uniref:Transport permease protein n=1 Tax=Prauserella marina TaxID=530584 RepID=A0A222VQY3_9PSEU|nr:ABC transporter permease [Prauserella marina]ASR36143.1 multidrug ABC transporter permease [Prauserella marina]PWV76888.1 ABC-2 type transport system permease protein [Prauserella marina]SDC99765.1 ABC-2 type transport system permease protein [Prauserella marina]
MSGSTFVSDTGAVFSRELRPVLRDPFSVIFSMVQPLIFLALFAPLLPGSVVGGSALQWFVPSIVVMSCLFGASATGANLLFEIQTGSHERMLVSPLSRPALIVGRALKEIVPMFAQALIIVLVAVPFGFRLNVAGALLGLVILGVFSVGIGALSYTLALASKNKEWLFWTVQQTVLFPVLLLAGMMLPVEGGPAWLRIASQVNPLTYVVEAQRALFGGELMSSAVAGGLAAAILVAAAGLAVGTRAIRRAGV